jgi:hypothetical protein
MSALKRGTHSFFPNIHLPKNKPLIDMRNSLAGIITQFLIFMFLFTSCEKRSELVTAESILTENQQFELIYSFIRYVGHLPSKADHETKFHSEYDEYYKTLVSRHKLEFIHQNSETDLYFLLSRPAPSLYDKHVAIAGRVVFDGSVGMKGKPSFYEEIFRTWKMEKSELHEKSAKLFSEMIREADLTKYYSENSGDEEYIEFPNKYTRFDTTERRWISELDLSISNSVHPASDHY